MSRLLAGIVAAVVGLGVLAGCGGGSSSSSAGSSATGTGNTSTSPSVRSAAPLSKDDYENRGLAAIQPALTAERAAGGQSNATTWGQVAAAYRTAHNDFQALTPPTDVADLHRQTVSVLGATANAATRIRDAYKSRDGPAGQAAVSDFRVQAHSLIALGRKFTARGYPKLGA